MLSVGCKANLNILECLVSLEIGVRIRGCGSDVVKYPELLCY